MNKIKKFMGWAFNHPLVIAIVCIIFVSIFLVMFFIVVLNPIYGWLVPWIEYISTIEPPIK